MVERVVGVCLDFRSAPEATRLVSVSKVSIQSDLDTGYSTYTYDGGAIRAISLCFVHLAASEWQQWGYGEMSRNTHAPADEETL